MSVPTRPSDATLKKLFARSGNRCAYLRCTVEIVHGATIVGEVCHIRASNPNGPRYDPKQPPAERHGYANLILLCPNHHTIVDDDPEAYSVDRLTKMKSDHEGHSGALAAGEAERGARLLVDESGGIAALPVHQTTNAHAHAPATPSPQRHHRHSLVARIRKFHDERVAKIAAAAAPVELLDGGVLIVHVVPLIAAHAQATPSFEEISRNPDMFPTIADNRARHSRVRYDGLLIGSNADGLSRPQRAYVQVFRTGAVEAVASSLARGREHNLLMLPQLQAMIIIYACIYARSLNAVGIPPPFVIVVSLVGVEAMRLLQDFIGNAFPEDIPFAALTDNRMQFDEAIFETTPSSYNECAKLLRPLLTHLANAADLSSSPYFDDDGNYTLRL